MPYIVDTDRLVYQLVRRFMPAALVMPERDVDAIDRLPLIIYTVGAGRATDNGEIRAAQIRPVSFMVLAGPDGERSATDVAQALADELIETVLERFELARVAGVGGVARVTDVTLPSRAATVAISGREIVQYNAGVELMVQPPRGGT